MYCICFLRYLFSFSHCVFTTHRSLEPENNFLNGPLNTLQSVKDAWHASPFTCINVSSADMLQFAIFFATTRQKGVPESLLSILPLSATALAKRDTLIADFLWGRPDELICEPDWTLNLPGFTTPASGGLIVDRCAGAGEELIRLTPLVLAPKKASLPG